MEDESATGASSAKETLATMILQRRHAAMDALNEYYKRFFANTTPPSHDLRASIWVLYEDLEPSLQESMTSTEFNELVNLLSSTKETDILTALRAMNSWLYKKGITRFDEKKVMY